MGLQSMGYDLAYSGINQWNGVAILSRVGIEDVEVGFAGMPGWGDPMAAEARAIGATCGGVRVWSLYVPNGRKIDDPHYVYKLDWLARLREAAHGWLGDDVCLVGDWNIAPRDEDVFDMAAYATDTHVTPPERAAFQAFLDDGWVDVVRPHTPGPDVFTYWDYYRQRFERNRGMRIDFVVGSPSFASRVTHAFIDRRSGPARAPPTTPRCWSTSTEPGLRRGSDVARVSALPWQCERGSHPLGRGSRTRPPDRGPRARAHPHRRRPRRRHRRPGRPRVRPRLRRRLRGRRAAGPAGGLLHRRRAAAADHAAVFVLVGSPTGSRSPATATAWRRPWSPASRTTRSPSASATPCAWSAWRSATSSPAPDGSASGRLRRRSGSRRRRRTAAPPAHRPTSR